MNISNAEFALLDEKRRNGGKFNVIILWVAGIELTEKLLGYDRINVIIANLVYYLL